MSQQIRHGGVNRRVFLKGVAATGAFLGFAGTASAHHGGSSVPGGCDFSVLDCDIGQADIMVLFDITRSMAQATDDNDETRFDNAKTAASNFVEAVADGDDNDSVRVGLLTFGNANQIGEVSSPPADFSDGVYGVEVEPTTDLATLATTIDGLNTHESGSNGTGTGSALEAVGVDDAFFDFDDDRNKYVIVVTDGEPNRDDPDAQTGDFLTPGPLNYAESRAYGVEQADALRDAGVRVIAIGVGGLTGDAADFIENVGGEEGNYYFTGSDPELVDYTSIFQSVLDELESCPVEVHIDVKYSSDPNGINPNSNGNIPVTVFGSDEFDVRDIDLDTMRFGPTDVVVGGGGAMLDHGDYTDQDGDGYEDFVAHFLTQDTGIEMGDDVLWLYFETEDGTAYAGCDSAKTVGGGGPNRGDDDDDYDDDDDDHDGDDYDDDYDDDDDHDGDDDDDDHDDDDDDRRGRGRGRGRSRR